MSKAKRSTGTGASKINRTLDRNYRTIRQALQHGMNVGAYGITNARLRNPSFHWRLVGDRVEHKRAKHSKWSWMDSRDLDRPFSRGVFGRCVRFSAHALSLEVAELASAAGRGEAEREDEQVFSFSLPEGESSTHN